MDQDLRQQHYDHFIQEYYNSLSTFLAELGSDANKLFPFEVLKEHLKNFSVYGLYMAMMVLFVMLSDPNEIPDINTLKEGETLNDKFQYVPKNNDKFRSRIRGVLYDYINLGCRT